MDVMIKGMDMPKTCCDCKLFSGEGYLCPLVENSKNWLQEVRYKRVADCPLFETSETIKSLNEEGEKCQN